ncbi:MAG: helix-turn-helix domain-containing protein [Desulfotomaculum sp.]|nr:helix-turn-helix domain-containing protein [Desulfotomaculum sp.]
MPKCTLFEHALKELSRQKSSKLIQLPFSKTAWAEYMNVSRTSLARELRQMSQDGLLSFDKKVIAVQNARKLKELLGISS